MYNLYLKEILKDKEGEGKAKEILWFPITSSPDEDFCEILSQRLHQYQNALKNNIDEVFKEVRGKTISKEQTISCVDILISGIEKCLESYRQGDLKKSYHYLFCALNKINLEKILKGSNRKCPLDQGTYYRIRKNLKTTSEKELYHIPFSKIHLCKDDRFNIKGYPCLYLSYERSGCETEMNYDKNVDTLASFEYKGGESVNILDLTWFFNENKFRNEQESILFHILWPLIASCYGISRYCKGARKECTTVPKLFKIEYVIPQMFAEYVQFHLKLDGIIYYTVRNEDLDISKSDMKNVVLFAEYKKGEDYDRKLMDNFKIKILEE